MKNKFIGRFILGLLLSAVIFLAVTEPPATYFPSIAISAGDSERDISLSFIFDHQASLSSCEALTGNAARIMLQRCPHCRIRKLTCELTLAPSEQELLSNIPVSFPSGRMSNGAIAFYSSSADLALSVCQASQIQSANSRNSIVCFPPNTPRDRTDTLSFIGIWHLVILLAAFAATWGTGWLIVRYEHLHAHFSHDHADDGPQKHHCQPTPRIGGVAVKVGLVAGGVVMLLAEAIPIEREFGLLLLAAVPAFLGGLIEDVTKRVGVLERLLLTMLASGIAGWLLGAILNRLDIPVLDRFLPWGPFAICITVFAVAGIANATNILDGYNGLVGGYAVIVLVGMAWVSAHVGDSLIFSVAITLVGATLGFLCWNWPGGKVFLGDGGAYVFGFFLGELSVLLVVRNANVSPWFPLLLLIHPVFETCYSVYRRKLKNGLSPGQPDNQHLHQLIYKRIGRIGDTGLSHNSRVAKFLWGPTVIVVMVSCLFWQTTGALVLIALIYCIAYLLTYKSLSIHKKSEVKSRP